MHTDVIYIMKYHDFERLKMKCHYSTYNSDNI